MTSTEYVYIWSDTNATHYSDEDICIVYAVASTSQLCVATTPCCRLASQNTYNNAHGISQCVYIPFQVQDKPKDFVLINFLNSKKSDNMRKMRARNSTSRIVDSSDYLGQWVDSWQRPWSSVSHCMDYCVFFSAKK